jgi:hypothetical protein
MAAVLAGGEGAVLSHRSGGALRGVASPGSRPDVTVAGWRRRDGDIAWHSSSLPADEVGECLGIPVTTVARTILDLAAVLDRHRLKQIMDKAENRLLADQVPLTARPGRSPAGVGRNARRE